jgi:hypothetical protein
VLHGVDFTQLPEAFAFAEKLELKPSSEQETLLDYLKRTDVVHEI